MKLDYKKDFKEYYLPPEKPVRVKLPGFRFFMIEGAGDPNSEAIVDGASFSDVVGALYSLSYTIKMMPKGGFTPEGYHEYTVFPLEGVWDFDISEGAPEDISKFDKSKLVYTMMIRQPDFVDEALARRALEAALAKKPGATARVALERARFASFEEGDCVQMMHTGPYDDEPRSFALLEAYCQAQGLVRRGHTHREIYLSDPNRVAPEKMKTVLRWMVG
jgi:hypothetical protein